MRRLIFTITALLAVTISNACDFCNYYLGLDPGYNKNTISLRGNYRMTSMDIAGSSGHKIMHGDPVSGSGGEEGLLEGSFVGIELNAKFFPTSKVMVVANLPYQFGSLSLNDNHETKSAIGDMTLMAFYQIANTLPDDSSKIRHRLFGGLGVKFPTGVSSGTEDLEIPMAHELNPGTGSTDYLAAISYIGKFKKLGWNVDVSYKYNTESKNEYQYGHTFNFMPRIFYEARLKSLTILPHIGLPFETCGHDYYSDVKIDESGGSIVWASGGIDFYFNRFSFTTDVRLPVSQDLNGDELEDKYWVFAAFNIHF